MPNHFKFYYPIQIMQYTNHSGGAVGADAYWDKKGRQYGITDHRHYYHGKRTPGGNQPITDRDLQLAMPYVHKANETLRRKGILPYLSLLGRSFYQVINADEVFAVGKLSYSVSQGVFIPQGGTAWAVQMAIDMGKTVHFFDGDTMYWYTFTPDSLTISQHPPTLTPSFAGIGTRKLTSHMMDAIDSVYRKTFES
jgi:hypothetical protein